MPKKSAPNAKDVLPKAVLSKLQRHCSGVIYIPAPQTQAEINMARVRSLQIHGHPVPRIAQIVGLSTKSVRNIIKHLENRNITGSSPQYKIYETVPQEVVELVQRHASGLIYVPPKMSQADRRRARVKRMINKGFCVVEIAKRTGLAERRVWQIRKAESADTQSRLMRIGPDARPTNAAYKIHSTSIPMWKNTFHREFARSVVRCWLMTTRTAISAAG